jgi:hypothetical protein
MPRRKFVESVGLQPIPTVNLSAANTAVHNFEALLSWMLHV